MRFVKNAPVRGETAVHPIRIVLLDRNVARFWHNEIQPFIREASERRFRPDARWRWPALLRLLPRVELLAGRRCFGYAVLARSATGAAIPVALLLIVEAHALLKNQAPGTFLWFAASAPAKVFEAFEVPRLGHLGQILVDTTLVTSMNAGLQGRSSLHADPGGDAYLGEFYEQRCGLRPVPKNAPLSGVRVNDGRYYYTDSLLAEALLRQLDGWR